MRGLAFITLTVMMNHASLSGTFLKVARHLVKAVACLSAGVAAPAMAQGAATADARGELLEPIDLEKIQDLDFGPMVPSGAGGVVTINPSTGAVTTVGNVVIVGSSQKRALFNVHAPIGVVMIMSGDPTVTLTRQSGTETMTATLNYVHGNGLAITNVFGLPIGLIATGTTQEIWTGGALTVSGTQAEGVYVGTFNLDVAFL